MKHHNISFIVLLIFFGGCTTIKETIFVQDVKVNSPITQSPIHLTDSSKYSFTISPKFSVTTTNTIPAKIEGHTNVNSNGIFQMDTIINNDGTFTFKETPGVNTNSFEGNNLYWNVTKVVAGFDLDFRISNSAAIFAGFNFSSQNNDDYLGGTLGLGLFKASAKYGYRMDVGLKWQSLFFDAQTIIETEIINSSTSTNFLVLYHDKNRVTNINPFFSFTYNSANYNWPFNFFFNAGYSRQTLIDFQPQTRVDRQNPFAVTRITEDTRGTYSASFVHFMPGFYFNLGSSSRFIVGVKFYYNTNSNRELNSAIVIPSVQADLRF